MSWKLKKTLLSEGFRPWSYPVVGFVLLIFLSLSLFFWGQVEAASLLTASREQIFSRHEYYRLFTTLAIHGDVKHFLSNAIFFFIFGFLLHSYFGWLWFPALSLVFGALTNYLTLAIYPEHSVLIGASGMVYFMAGAWATLFFFIERQWKPIKRAMAALGVSLILFFPTEYQPEVSYLAHGIGFLLGIGVAAAYFWMNRRNIQAKEIWIYRDDEPFLSLDSDGYVTEVDGRVSQSS